MSSAQQQQHEQIRTDAYFVISMCHTYWSKCFTYLCSFAAYVAKRVRCYYCTHFIDEDMHHKERKQLATLHSWEVPKAAFEPDPLAAKPVLN